MTVDFVMGLQINLHLHRLHLQTLLDPKTPRTPLSVLVETIGVRESVGMVSDYPMCYLLSLIIHSGFNCRFRHIENPDRKTEQKNASSSQARATTSNDSGIGNGEVLFATEGKPYTPGETHNYLKKFLQDTFRFMNSSATAARFLRLISCAMSPTWVRFLYSLILNCIHDILSS